MSHKVWSDTKNNRLYVKVGLMELERMDEFKEKITKEISNLKKDFSCIADFRNFRADVTLMPPDILKTYSNYFKWLIDAGMGEMVRVVEPQIYMISMIINEDLKEGASVTYVDSMERAEWIFSNKE